MAPFTWAHKALEFYQVFGQLKAYPKSIMADFERFRWAEMW